MKIRKNLKWEYNGDGRFEKNRIKGIDKRYWRKWLARTDRKQAIKDSQ